MAQKKTILPPYGGFFISLLIFLSLQSNIFFFRQPNFLTKKFLFFRQVKFFEKKDAFFEKKILPLSIEMTRK